MENPADSNVWYESMTRLLIETARWLGNKLMILLILIALLLVSGWIAMEYVKLKERIENAETTERVIGNLESELGPIRERRDALKAELSGVMKEVGEVRDLREQALLVERRARARLDKVGDEKRWYYSRLTHAKYFARLAEAEWSHAAAEKAAAAASVKFTALRKTFEDSPTGRELLEINQSIENRAADIATLRAQALQDREDAAAHPLERLRRQVARVFPTALGILVVLILLPVIVKAVLYFAVAPLISRARPVRLLPDMLGSAAVSTAEVSVPIELGEGDELIVHSDYLQAAGAGPGKKTRVLFSWKMPFTSLAAGLFLMVAVRNPGGALAKVTVSPKRDLFDKLSRVTLPEGAAMVVYPRSLVGAILRNRETPGITRHWRLGNLHSWLTFQLRYLVIHGPCDFIVKGCRGVRAGEVTPENPRMQDQCATLGFSANLEYSAIRCETFIDYLRGRDGLFNDRFASAPGFHLTEEIPDPRRKTALFGRGIEGMVDGLLKGFGI
jgi:hypothetical protein